MLRISKLADYGVLLMVYIAKHPSEPCSANEIAANTHIGLATVSKLLKKLTAAGLLVSVRGVNGGYSLARDAVKITLADILRGLEKSKGLTLCSSTPNLCHLRTVCQIQDNWQFINEMIVSSLQAVSLAKLTQSKWAVSSSLAQDAGVIKKSEQRR